MERVISDYCEYGRGQFLTADLEGELDPKGICSAGPPRSDIKDLQAALQKNQKNVLSRIHHSRLYPCI